MLYFSSMFKSSCHIIIKLLYQLIHSVHYTYTIDRMHISIRKAVVVF